MTASPPRWLTARPIAHRGLHDAARGIVENTASAAAAAIRGNYGIEADLQVSADGEAMVFHDDTLDRLAEATGAVGDRTAAALAQVALKLTGDRILTLGGLLDLVAGRATLLLELKSRFDGDLRLAARTAAVLGAHPGPVAVMSFDPAPIAHLRRLSPHLVRGLVGERAAVHPRFGAPRGPASLLHALSSRPAFLAWRIDDLAGIAPRAARTMFGLPLLAWTVRSPHQRMMAAGGADQIIFEGFRA